MDVLIPLAVAAIVAVVFGCIFRKMGFSAFTGLLVVVPIANLLWFLYLATSEWPIERELAERPEPTEQGREDHLSLMFRRAEAVERCGDYEEALKLFEILAKELKGQAGAHFATHCANRLRKRVDPAS